MIRGTTPTIIFKLPFEVSIINKIYITFSQFKEEIFTVDKEGCILSENEVSVHLTQTQTLSLTHNREVEMQIRIMDNSGESLASNIMKVDVERILKDGEI